ncbi:MAG: GNAT family N-acetyltransferase [Syntrophales bacterium]|jgi:ribosomal-protein-serine acetyltransferase
MIRLQNLYDAEEIFRLIEKNRSRLREWFPWLDSTKTAADVKLLITKALIGHAGGNRFDNVIITDGQIAGLVAFDWINHGNKSAGVKYWIDIDVGGKGILTCSVVELIEIAFGSMGMHRIEIRAASGNAKSCAVAMRLGMRLEGTIKDAEWLYDHYVDHNIYAITKPEWGLGNRVAGGFSPSGRLAAHLTPRRAL